jgi:hypothetical protein
MLDPKYSVFLSFREYVCTALCAYSKPRNIFESGALRHFQKYFFTTQSLNMFVFSSTMRIQTYLGLTQYPCNKLRAESLTPLKRFDYRLS